MSDTFLGEARRVGGAFFTRDRESDRTTELRSPILSIMSGGAVHVLPGPPLSVRELTLSDFERFRLEFPIQTEASLLSAPVQVAAALSGAGEKAKI